VEVEMAMKSLCKVAVLFFTFTMLGDVILAEGPIRKRVDFTVNADYRLRMQNYLLPAGKYILYQVSDNNPHLFGLYQEDLARSPIAMVHTARIDYTTRWPQKTAMHWHLQESFGRSGPVITGWQIPGMDGWEIIAVVPRGRGLNILTRVR
jgi:hypothetical protein